MSSRLRAKKRLAPDVWFEHGDKFEIAVHALVGGKNNSRIGPLGLPTVTLRAFAVEAYLKCLIELTGRAAPWKHNFLDLFRELNVKDRQALRAAWRTEYAPKIRAWNKMKPDAMLGKLPIGLDRALEACGDAFMLFRYGPEEGVAPFTLMNFPLSIRRHILRLRPDFRPRPDPLDFESKAQSGRRFRSDFSVPATGWSILNPESGPFKAVQAFRRANSNDHDTK